MTEADPAPETPREEEHLPPRSPTWILGGGMIGALLGLALGGQIGFYMGLAIGLLLEAIMGATWADRRQPFLMQSVFIVFVGLLLGYVIGVFVATRQEMPKGSFTLSLTGAELGLLLGIADRLVIWVLFPPGAKEPPQSVPPENEDSPAPAEEHNEDPSF